jgi:hypothetical protein
MKNRFAMSRTGEMDVQWCRFRVKKEIPDYGDQADGGRAGCDREQRKRGKSLDNIDRGVACSGP